MPLLPTADPKSPKSPFQTTLPIWDTATELPVGFLWKEKRCLMWKDTPWAAVASQMSLQLLAVFKSAHGGGEVRASCPGSPRPGPSDRLSRGCSCAHPAQQNQRCATSFPAPGTTQCPFIHFPPVAPAATLALAGCFCYEEKLMAGLDMS